MTENFDVNNFDEQNWYFSSEKLQISADHMLSSINQAYKNDQKDEKSVSFFYACILLLGYSMENFLNGASIEIFKLKNPDRIINSFKELKKEVWGLGNNKTGHEMKHIYSYIGLDLLQTEETLLNKLEEYIMWRGKYPAPITSGSVNSINNSIAKSDIELIKKIKKKINYEIEKERKKG